MIRHECLDILRKFEILIALLSSLMSAYKITITLYWHFDLLCDWHL